MIRRRRCRGAATGGSRRRRRGERRANRRTRRHRATAGGFTSSCQHAAIGASAQQHLVCEDKPNRATIAAGHLPRMLERTTVDCLFAGLAEVSPFDLTGAALPLQIKVRWVWLVFVCDEASANKRAFVFIESNLMCSRPGMLSCNLPCLIHILHLGVDPLLQ